MPVRLESASVEPAVEAGAPSRGDAIIGRILVAAPLGTLVVLLVILTQRASRPLGNYDTWFHLRMGAEFWGPWSVGHPGRLSEFATSQWVPSQWLTEVAASRFEAWWGLPGVAWFFGVLYLVFALAVYGSCRQNSGPLISVIATVLAVLGAGFALSARPQMVSLILLSVTLTAWLRTSRDHRARWWLVPMTWLWASAHGLWSVGVLLGMVCCLALLLERQMRRRQLLRAVAIPVLSAVAALLTPVGPRLLTTQTAVMVRSGLIPEWGPTSFHDLPALCVALMVAAVFAVWMRRGEPLAWNQVLLVLLATGLTMYSLRLVAVGALLIAPIFADALQTFLTDRSPARRASGELVTISVSTAACAVVLALTVPHTADAPAGVPSGMASRLQSLRPGSAVLNTDYLGGWIEWRFPRLNPVLDGMFDAYPVRYIRRYDDAAALKPGWQRFVEQSGAEVAVLRTRSPLAAALEDQLAWRPVEVDGKWAYLVAPAGASD